MAAHGRRVVIVGAGLGGLTCALALQRAGFEVRVYERDRNLEARAQGFVVNLESGLLALDRVGLGGAVREAGFPTPGLDLLDHAGRKLISFPSRGAFSVGRPVLRRLLLDAVTPSTVVWNARCLGYDESADRAVARFEGGREEAGDLVVGCDGVRSAIRRQMHGDRLFYLGVSIVGGEVDGEAAAAAAPALAPGKFMTLTPRGSCYATLYSGENRIRWSIGLRVEQGELEQRFPDPAQLKEAIMALVRGWPDPVPRLVAATSPDRTRIRPVFDGDPLEPWTSGRVTLLGDAAHPMSPYRGLGANLAMEDATDLAAALCDPALPGLAAAVSSYETLMLRRGAAAQSVSRRLARMLHLESRFACLLRNGALRAGSLLARAAR